MGHTSRVLQRLSYSKKKEIEIPSVGIFKIRLNKMLINIQQVTTLCWLLEKATALPCPVQTPSLSWLVLSSM